MDKGSFHGTSGEPGRNRCDRSRPWMLLRGRDLGARECNHGLKKGCGGDFMPK
jgi:hypothetical protein